MLPIPVLQTDFLYQEVSGFAYLTSLLDLIRPYYYSYPIGSRRSSGALRTQYYVAQH